MKTQSILKAIKKAGLTFETEYHGPNLYYICKTDKRKLTWYGDEKTDEASCVHISRITEKPRMETDSFPGFFVDTIKHAMKYLTE